MLAGQPVTMEDVLAETAITYPETYVQTMTGSQIKDIARRRLRQSVQCRSLLPAGRRHGSRRRHDLYLLARRSRWAIGSPTLKLDNGRGIEAGKSYKVAGWASVNAQQGTPVWDVFAKHLRSGKPRDPRGADVTLKGVDDNPGITEQG